MPEPNVAFAAIERLRAVTEPVQRLVEQIESIPAVAATREIRARIAATQPEIIPYPPKETTHV